MKFKGIFFIFTLLLATNSAMAGNDLTNQLYNSLTRNSGNVVFSPISVHAILSMAYQGSDLKTYEAFIKVFQIGPDVIANGYKDLMALLNNVSDVDLTMANKIYIMKGYTLKQHFKDVITNKFLSAVQDVNFTDSSTAAKTINDWVEDSTRNKIKNIINPDILNDMTRLVLVNAIYFKGQWLTQFDPKLTITDKFYLNDNDSIDVQMMNIQTKYLYKENRDLDAKVLELPYSNPEISLIIVLPNKKNGIAELEKKLAVTDLTMLSDNMFITEVIVKLPKFKIFSTIDLVEPIKELGLGIIFSKRDADFSKMVEGHLNSSIAEPEHLYVNQIIQKTFIEINEKGTQSAAATESLNKVKINPVLPQPPPMTFYADHPFAFTLIYKKAIILFAGRISAPV